MPGFNLRMSDDLHTDLSFIADIDGTTMNKLAVKAVDEFIQKRLAEPEFIERVRIANRKQLAFLEKTQAGKP